MARAIKPMFRYLSRIILLVAACISVSVHASKAPFMLDDYPHARQVFRSEGAEDDYVLALGSFKKIDGLWSVDRQQRLSGLLTRQTLELPSGHSAEEGFQFYVKQLQNFSARQLYRCDARECGPSNSWANNHFKIIQLYGLDQHQHYAAYELNLERQPSIYLSVYSVLRGNKRVYVQIEILQTEQAGQAVVATDPDTLLRLLLTRGYYIFPDLVVVDRQGKNSLDIRPAHLQALVTLLQRQPGLRIALVGHDYAPVDLTRQLKNSELHAQGLQAALIKAGVDKQRLVIRGLGSLAPAGRGNASARVEIVHLAQ